MVTLACIVYCAGTGGLLLALLVALAWGLKR